jgi:hypothetical protein
MRIEGYIHKFLSSLQLDQLSILTLRQVASLFEKITRTRQNLSFLIQCSSLQLLPNFILNITRHLTERETDHRIIYKVHNLQWTLLNKAINKSRRTLYALISEVKVISTTAREMTSNTIWNNFSQKSMTNCKNIKLQLQKKLNKKITALQLQQLPKRNTAPPVTDKENRITIIGNVTLANSEKSLLDKGPSFAPSRKITINTRREITANIQNLGIRLRWMKTCTSNDTQQQQPVLKSMENACPFDKPHAKFPPTFPDIECKLQLLNKQAMKLLTMQELYQFDNLSKDERKSLSVLKKKITDGEIRISTSDKGGEFVIAEQTLDKAITFLHLSDSSIYLETNKEHFERGVKTVKHAWESVCQQRCINDAFKKRIANNNPTCPVMYVLIKTHKIKNLDLQNSDVSKFNCRPIISGCGGPADRVSWVLSFILSPLLNIIPAHLKNTNHLLEELNKLNTFAAGNNLVFESFDVTALYTNINNEEAIKCVIKLLQNNRGNINFHGFRICDIECLLTACLANNTFKFNNKYFCQIRGLAMGNRLAPILAIAYMDYIENQCVLNDLILYKRYIDDTLIIAENQMKLDYVFQTINTIDPNIKFTREKPTNGWLPFLDTEINIQNQVQTKWYRKPMKKNIILHATSAHPSYIKTNVVNAMYNKADFVTSKQFKPEIKIKALAIATSNGYTSKHFSNYHGQSYFRKGVPILKIPFISDQYTKQLQKELIRLEIPAQIVITSPLSLEKLLIKSRIYDNNCPKQFCDICNSNNNKDGTCQIKGCIYKIVCNACGLFYIGETMQPLYMRYGQHLGDIRHPERQKPWSEHVRSKHNSIATDTTITVLMKEHRTILRKIYEAIYIQELKPEINVKREMNDALKFLCIGL